MKKAHKVLIATLVIAIVGAVALIVANYTSLSFVKFQCENYLSRKYDADKSEFELIDYKKSHFFGITTLSSCQNLIGQIFRLNTSITTNYFLLIELILNFMMITKLMMLRNGVLTG